MADVSIGPLSAEEARIQNAADQAYRVLEDNGSAPANTTARLLDLVRDRTREAPLQALGVAFILGVMLARRR
jgi:hypothetical protein